MRQPESPVQSQRDWVLGGRYRVLDRLGQGGMADVFRAHDELLDRDVAVKVFRTVAQAGEADTQADLRRELELQSLARLSHPNLITLFDGSVSGDGPGYLVLELVQGADLASRLHDGPLPEPLARRICAQIAEALGYVHAHGMVHRDVKPANILLGEDGRPENLRARLGDFGIVRMIGSERMTAADLTLGTVSYIAPEQARGANVEPAADIYSLGLVMIEALTGVRCFDGPLHEALAARLVASPTIPAHLPAPWPALLAAMTATDPAQRPTAEEVAQALHGESVAGLATVTAPTLAPALAPAAALGADLPTGAVSPAAVPLAAPPVSRPPAEDDWYPEGDRPRRGGMVLLAILALAAIVAGGAYFLMSGSAQPATKTPAVSPAVHRSAPASHTSHHRSVVGVVQSSGAPSHSAHTTSRAAVHHHPKATASHSTATSSPSPSLTTSAAPSTSTTPPPTTSAPVGTPVASGGVATP